ncbi:MAG: repressor [Gammaproteobacteria bacterium RIFOXYA12_FULL_61_12]|nr:MAG: repressor [Gammaproteobacteria bacterium RIFOXYA12_FULL_61_12]
MRPSETNRDLEYLNRLRDYHARNQRIPSLQRIAELMGFASKAASSKLLERLEASGYLERTADGDAWMPTENFFARPLSGVAVCAGMPEVIDGGEGSPFFVDQYLVRNPSTTVMIPSRGDSMVDAGIHEGDIAVVDRSRTAVIGDFVIAIVDDEFTLKELAKEKERFILKPHNIGYPVIRPKGDLEIYGVVIGIVRKYRD